MKSIKGEKQHPLMSPIDQSISFMIPLTSIRPQFLHYSACRTATKVPSSRVLTFKIPNMEKTA
jgi:hypothetical protein